MGPQRKGAKVQPLAPTQRLSARDAACADARHQRAPYDRSVSERPVRYRSVDEDSGRWTDFPFRDGDIVISTRSKSGTTWVQMICALLIFQTTELPAELPPCRRGWTSWYAEGRGVRAARSARAPPVHQDPHAVGRDPDRRPRHLHRCRPPSARHGCLALPPGQQHRPRAGGGRSPGNEQRPVRRHRGCRCTTGWLRGSAVRKIHVSRWTRCWC